MGLTVNSELLCGLSWVFYSVTTIKRNIAYMQVLCVNPMYIALLAMVNSQSEKNKVNTIKYIILLI